MGACRAGRCIGIAAFHLPPAQHAIEANGIRAHGGLGNSLVIRCSLAGAGFRYVVSTGNEADVGLSELIDAYVQDPQTRVILTYLEGVGDGRALMRSLERACLADKPVIVLKGGNTEAGKAAASSHTANLTGSYDIYRAAFQQCGAIEVEDLDEAADYAVCLLNGRLPRGCRVAAMGASGGSAAVFSDAAESYGLELPPLADTTLAVLKETLPPIASLRNPVDYTSGYPRPDTRIAFQRAFDAVLGDPRVHQLGLLFATPNRRQLMIASELLTNAAAESDKPLFVFSVIPPEITPEGVETLKQAGIPVLSSPRRIARAMAMLTDHAEARERVRSAAIPDGDAPVFTPLSVPPGPIVLDEHESKAILARAGIPVTRDVLLPLEADESPFTAVRFPAAVKIVSRDLLHKSDIGAVVLNVGDEAQLRAAATQVVERSRRARPDARLSGVLACEMVPDGVEVIVGAINDLGFGPVIALGMGGIFTETLDDVTYGIAPFGRAEALRMINGLRARTLFDGLRGRTARDVDALVDTLVRVSGLAWQLRDRLVEMDINPLLVRARGHGVVAADAVLSLRDGTTHEMRR